MPAYNRLDALREWIVAPIIVPFCLGALMVLAILIRQAG